MLYTPKEVGEKLGITTTTLQKWVQFFDIKTEWTKADGTGHRRYTDAHLEQLTVIKEKVQNLNWSWDKTKAFLSGDETVNQEMRTTTELKMDQILAILESQSEMMKNQEQFLKNQEQFNQLLVKRLEQSEKENQELRKMYEKQTQLLIETQNQIEKKREEADESAEREKLEEAITKPSWWQRVLGK